MQQINNVIYRKLHSLSSFLDHAYEEFENLAKQVKDKNIKMSVRSIAVETKQYIEELNSQLKALSVKNIFETDRGKRTVRIKLIEDKDITDKKIIEQCCTAEINFETAYRSLLNEYFPYAGLRDMLVYQLNGIKCAFMQLKLLKSVMPPETHVSVVLF